MASRYGRAVVGRALGLSACCLLAFSTAAIAAPPDFTWSGAAANTSTEWSNAGDWVQATAPIPSESLGTVSFPQLGSCGGTTSCYLSDNDVSGLSANAISVDDTAGYAITGAGLTLGGGGLTAFPGSPIHTAAPDVDWEIGLTLTANQTWSITGANTSDDQGNLVLSDPVSGPYALAVRLANQGYLNEKGGMNVSAFTATGANTADTGSKAALNGTMWPTSLNSSPADPVSVTDVVFADEPNLTNQPYTDDIGPLTATGAFVDVGDGNVPDAILSVAGGVTLNAATVTQLSIDQSGTTPSTDYSQMTATGNIALGGALSISSGNCSLGTGSTDTLITTSGTLSGTFTNAPDGALVAFVGCPSLAAQIHYTSNSVTATVVSGSSSATMLSASANTTTTGQPVTLTASVTTGTPLQAGPAGTVAFSDGATPIAGCTAQPLTASSATAGSATCTFSSSAAGAHAITAAYAGDGTSSGSSSSAVTVTVQGATTTTTTSAGAGTTTTGQAPATTTTSSATTTTTTSQAARTTTSPVTGTTTGPATGPTASATLGQVRVTGTTAHVPVTCAGPTGCTVTLKLTIVETVKGNHVTAVTARKSKRKTRTVTLGTARVTIAADRSETIKVALNATGKRLLARHHKLSVRLTLSQSAAGRTRTQTKVAVFRKQ